MSIRYITPQNICEVCGIRTRGLPCPTCTEVKEEVISIWKKIWKKVKSLFSKGYKKFFKVKC